MMASTVSLDNFKGAHESTCETCGGTYQVSRFHPVEGRCVVHTPITQRRLTGGGRSGP